MPERAVDVAIIGGGTAGALAALALGRAGYQVTLIERGTTPGLNGADVLKPSGIEIVEQFGLLNVLLQKEARKRTALRIFHDGAYVDTLDYRQQSRRGYFILVPYGVLLNSVLEKLDELPNVERLFGTEVEALDFRGEQLESLRLSRGHTRSARVVIGADGANSLVRGRLGIAAERRLYPQKMYFAKFPLVRSVEECNRLYVDNKSRLAYFYPINHNQFRVVVAFPREEGDALVSCATSPSALQSCLTQFVTESSDAIDAIRELSLFQTIPIGCMHVDRYYVGNVVLIGDAIHNVHPITGQGMNLSIEDASALVKHLLPALEGERTLESALAAYQAERSPINEKIVSYGHQLVMALPERGAFLRSLNLRIQSSSRNSQDLASITLCRQALG